MLISRLLASLLILGAIGIVLFNRVTWGELAIVLAMAGLGILIEAFGTRIVEVLRSSAKDT